MHRLLIAAALFTACHGEARRDAPPAAPAAAPAHPAAAGSPIALSLATRGTELTVTLTNVSPAAVKIARRIEAARVDHDWLTVMLTDAAGAGHVLRFISARHESARIDVDLAPGAAADERIDLAEAAFHDGAPLAPGTYRVMAIWDAMHETDTLAFVVEATATLTVPAPVEQGCAVSGYHAPAGAALQLLARQVGAGVTVEVGLHNTGTADVCVWGRIQTHEIQSDWLTFGSTGITPGWVIALDDSRDKSYPVAILLAPGATAWSRWDLAAWAQRPRNGGKALAAGDVWATAVYDSSKATEVWAGKLTASVLLRVP